MKILRNIGNFLTRYSFTEIIKFTLIAGVSIFIAVLLFKFLLILILGAFLIRLIAPYIMRAKFSKTEFNSEPTHFKVVGEEEKQRQKNKENN